MSGTEAVYIPSEKMYNELGYSDTISKLEDEAEYAEDIWNSDIGTSSNYEIVVNSTTYWRVEYDDPDDSKEALNQAEDYINEETSIWDDYDIDAVIVYDIRDDLGAGGRAYVGTAGTSSGVGIVTGTGYEYQTGAHELGHVYGGSHNEPDTHWSYEYNNKARQYEESLLSVSNSVTCYGTDTSYTRTGWYSGCMRDEAHDTIDGI